MRQFLLLALFSSAALAADVCDPRGFEGPYAFQLSGETRISSDGKPKPAASIGNLVFDGRGGLSGYSSAHYAGFLQGNPTSGSYEVHPDCSIAWSLQDDSGAFQHFAGKVTPDFKRIQFQQTDPGGPHRGIMMRTADSCSTNALRPQYQVSITGSFTPMLEGQEPYRVNSSGTALPTAAGKVSFDFNGGAAPLEGTIDVDASCVVQIEVAGSSPMNLRGFLVDDGNEILAIQTDPGFTVIAHFVVQ